MINSRVFAEFGTVWVMIRQFLAFALLVSAIEAFCPGGLRAAEVNAILKSHNRLRSNISKGKFYANITKMPAAKWKIPALKWDCELEKSAQNVTKQCVYMHSTNRNYVGENLWTMSSSDKLKIAGMGKKASNSWKSEFQEYGWPSIKFTMDALDPEKFLGHATQMAWQNTTTIGCGISLCNGAKQVIVACHYNPTGNWLGVPIYVPKRTVKN